MHKTDFYKADEEQGGGESPSSPEKVKELADYDITVTTSAEGLERIVPPLLHPGCTLENQGRGPLIDSWRRICSFANESGFNGRELTRVAKFAGKDGLICAYLNPWYAILFLHTCSA